MITSKTSSTNVRRAGAGWPPQPYPAVFPLPPSPQRCTTSTATARRACRRTCCKLSVTTSVRTPTSASTSPVVSSSTPTGLAVAVTPHRPLITCKNECCVSCNGSPRTLPSQYRSVPVPFRPSQYNPFLSSSSLTSLI